MRPGDSVQWRLGEEMEIRARMNLDMRIWRKLRRQFPWSRGNLQLNEVRRRIEGQMEDGMEIERL
jgi:hypothetical protein